MSRKPPDPKREYTPLEQNEGFIGRRIRAFGERSRDPGDGATWAVVLGSFMWTLLVVCYSVSGQPLIALACLVLTLVWVGLMSRFGKVNVISVLWGSATTDFDRVPNQAVVFQSTLLVALISLISVAIDAIRGMAFSWYGYVLLASALVYFVVYIRSWSQPVR